MSKLDELINKLCPNGVEFKTLGELGKFYGGLTGKSKEDFNKGNAKFITYKNVYENLSLKIDVEDRVNVGENEKQRTLEYGDIIFTGSSETSDECGISSVLTQITEEKLYLNSFCFFLRLNDKNLLNPDFTKHLFRSSNLRYQIGKTASGVTRFNVSKKAMERVCIPVPPLEVQCEIVRILDNFTLLSAELSAELSARQKQFEYYKEILLEKNLSNKVRLGDCLLKVENIKWKQTNDTHLYIDLSSVDRERHRIINTTEINKSNAPSRAQQIVKTNDVLFGGTRPMLKRSCLIEKQYNNEICSTGFCVLRANTDKILPKWIYFMISTNSFYNYVEQNQKGASYPAITDGAIKDYKISLPSLKEQEKMVELLDKFEKYNNDMFEGLPAEIEARQKQYEYYRDKLLAFKELKVDE